MLRIIGCITDQHDLRLVVLAALICIIGCYTAFSLKARALAGGHLSRNLWLAAAAFVTGSGVWATHFVAELAFRPGLPIAYDVGFTALSVVVAVLVSGLGFAIALGRGTHSTALGGVVVGLGVAAMHYTGMAALRLPATAQWDIDYVIASIIVSAVFSSLAMIAARSRGDLLGRFQATGLLVLADCRPALHRDGRRHVFPRPDDCDPRPGDIAGMARRRDRGDHDPDRRSRTDRLQRRSAPGRAFGARSRALARAYRGA